MREYHRDACERVIRYGDAWALRHELKWHDGGRYPRLTEWGHDNESRRLEVWYVESATQCARALLHGGDLRYAFRCYVQVREYAARRRGAPDSYWSDLVIGLQAALEECLGLLTDYTPNNCDSAQVPKCPQCGERRYSDDHRCL